MFEMRFSCAGRAGTSAVARGRSLSLTGAVCGRQRGSARSGCTGLLAREAAVWRGLAAISPRLPGKRRVLSAAFYLGSVSIPPSACPAAAVTTPA